MTDERANEVYNKLNFLFSIMFPLLDEAQETTKPMRQVKFHMNRLLEEAQKEYKVFFDEYKTHGSITQPDGVIIHSQDIWKITEQSYEDLFEIIFNNRPNEIASLVHLHKKIIEQGVDLGKIEFQYKPIKFKEDEKNR